MFFIDISQSSTTVLTHSTSRTFRRTNSQSASRPRSPFQATVSHTRRKFSKSATQATDTSTLCGALINCEPPQRCVPISHCYAFSVAVLTVQCYCCSQIVSTAYQKWKKVLHPGIVVLHRIFTQNHATFFVHGEHILCGFDFAPTVVVTDCLKSVLRQVIIRVQLASNKSISMGRPIPFTNRWFGTLFLEYFQLFSSFIAKVRSTLRDPPQQRSSLPRISLCTL